DVVVIIVFFRGYRFAYRTLCFSLVLFVDIHVGIGIEGVIDLAELVVFDECLFIEIFVGEFGGLLVFGLLLELVGRDHLFIVVSHLSSFVVVR
ncbi:MAG: hypothetical protein ACXVJ3_19490, partial [Ilumatobacteraceae bacterium]